MPKTEGLFSIGLGFRFCEEMAGSYFVLSDGVPEHDVSLKLVGRTYGLRRLFREQRVHIEGLLDIAGFATNRPVRGSISLHSPADWRLIYEMTFAADDGRPYTFRGEKDIFWVSLLDSITTLPASVYDADGIEVGRASLRFDIRGDLINFIRSCRVVVHPT